MEEDVGMDSPILIEAFRIWSGWGVSSWPALSESRLKLQFGDGQAERLMTVINRLSDDFYKTDAGEKEADLVKMGNIARAQFKALHPEVAEEIVEILKWRYSYDFK